VGGAGEELKAKLKAKLDMARAKAEEISRTARNMYIILSSALEDAAKLLAPDEAEALKVAEILTTRVLRCAFTIIDDSKDIANIVTKLNVEPKYPQ
jgi:hypothetical protein